MKNPWEEIPLTDYENHMKLDSVMQLQTMNKLMKAQFDTYPISSVMILGVAGGNGLEHIQKNKFDVRGAEYTIKVQVMPATQRKPANQETPAFEQIPSTI